MRILTYSCMRTLQTALSARSGTSRLAASLRSVDKVASNNVDAFGANRARRAPKERLLKYYRDMKQGFKETGSDSSEAMGEL
jgi:hypothetical protein